MWIEAVSESRYDQIAESLVDMITDPTLAVSTLSIRSEALVPQQSFSPSWKPRMSALDQILYLRTRM
jgi:hypothetical protein